MPNAEALPKSLLTALNDLLWALPATLDAGAIVGVLLEKAARLFEAPLACVWLREGDALGLSGCYGFTAKKAEQLCERLDLADRPPESFALYGPELHALTSFGKRRLGALVATPLTSRTGPTGWLVLARFEPVALSDIELEFLALLAGRVGAALDTARVYEEARAQARELGLLNEVGQLLVSTIQLDELLDRIVRRMTETFALTGCLIALADPGTQTAPVRAIHMRDREAEARLASLFRDRPLRLDAGRTGEIMAHREPYLVPNLQEDPLVRLDTREALGTGSLVAVPLVVRGRAVGLMYWFRAGKQYPFTRADMPLIMHLGNQIAVAIDNAQLYADMARQVEARAERLLAASGPAPGVEAALARSRAIADSRDTALAYAALLHQDLAAAGAASPSMLEHLERLVAEVDRLADLASEPGGAQKRRAGR